MAYSYLWTKIALPLEGSGGETLSGAVCDPVVKTVMAWTQSQLGWRGENPTRGVEVGHPLDRVALWMGIGKRGRERTTLLEGQVHLAGWQCSEGILFPPGYPLSSCELFPSHRRRIVR